MTHSMRLALTFIGACVLSTLSLVTHVNATPLTIKLHVSSRPPAYLSDWTNNPDVSVVTVSNPNATPVDVKFDCRISLDGTLKAATKFESMRVVTVDPGVHQFYGEDIIPFDAVKFYGAEQTTAARSGMLPAGAYQICVTLRDPKSGSTISTDECQNFTLVSYQAPVLLEPADNTQIVEGKRITFRWTPVTPRPTATPTYRVMLFEVLAGQTPTTAFRVNRPILDHEVATTQLLWPPDVEAPHAGMQYVWGVIATDAQGNTLGEPGGLGGPASFAIVTTVSGTNSDSSRVNRPILDHGIALAADGRAIRDSAHIADTSGAIEIVPNVADTAGDFESSIGREGVYITQGTSALPQYKSMTVQPTQPIELCACDNASKILTWHTIINPNPCSWSGNHYHYDIYVDGSSTPVISGSYNGGPCTWNANGPNVPISSSPPTSPFAAPGVHYCHLVVTRYTTPQRTATTDFEVHTYPSLASASTSVGELCADGNAQLLASPCPTSAAVQWDYFDWLPPTPPSNPTYTAWLSGYPLNTNPINSSLCGTTQGSFRRTYRATINYGAYGLPAPQSQLACLQPASATITVDCPPSLGPISVTPDPNHTVSAEGYICSNQNYPITLNLSSNVTVGQLQPWTVTPVSGASITSSGNQGICTITHAGSYTVCVSATSGQCQAVSQCSTIVVTDPPPQPTIQIIEKNNVPGSYLCGLQICPHDFATMKVGNSGSMPPGTTYQWYYKPNQASDPCSTFPSGWIAAGQGPQQNTNSIGPLGSNWTNVWWMVEASDELHQCQPVASSCCEFIVLPPPCEPQVSPSGFVQKCVGGSIPIVGTPCGATSGTVSYYQWYHDGSPIGGHIVPPASLNMMASATGEYILEATGDCGTAQSVPVIVEDVLTTVEISGTCCGTAGQPVILTAIPTTSCTTQTGQGQFSWSTGEHTSTIQVSPTSTTTYTVMYTDPCGCSSTATYTVTICN